MGSDGERYFRQLFGPSVGLLCSKDSDEVVRRNGVNIIQFFQPFTCVNTELKSRDPHGQLHGLSNFSINFRNLKDEPISTEKLQIRLDEVLENHKEVRKEPFRFESENYNLNINVACPWFQKYRDIYLGNTLIHPHERLRHIVSSILVVSSENLDPMGEFRTLADFHRQKQLESQKAIDYSHKDPAQNFWFSESTKICFLLLHDVHLGSEAKAQEVYANLKQTFGEKNGFLLRVNSKGETGPDPWLQFCDNQTQVARLCDVKDQDSIREFVKDLSTDTIIPHLEQESKKLLEVIQNRRALHRSLFSATKKLFGGSNSKSSLQERYTESVEVQIRRFGDLCFLLQLYELAAQYYATAKREMSNEQSWIEATSASEFAAIAQFMAGGNLRAAFPKQAAAFAINSFLNLDQKDLALRSGFITLEASKGVGAWTDTAKDYLRFSKGFSSNQIAMFTEQAALCYLRAGHGRQFGFQSVLAGFQYKLSGLRALALRNYRNAVDVYDSKGWKAAELHVHEVTGELSQYLGESLEAERSYCAGLSLGTGQNAAVFTNYLAMVQYNNKHKGTNIKTSFPKIDCNSIEVSVSRFPESSQSTGESYRDEVIRMRNLEDNCLKAANDGVAPITFKTTIPSERRNNFTFNERPLNIASSDSVSVAVPIENTLNNSLMLSDISLLGDGDFDCSSSLDNYILDAKIKSILRFKVSPKTCGQLKITGIKYMLTTPDVESSVVIEATQEFTIKGQRQNKLPKDRKGVFHSEDMRLTLNVIDEMPTLNLSVGNLPERLIAGEIYKTSLEISNNGTSDAMNCWFNHNQKGQLSISDGEINPRIVQLSSFPSLVSLGNIAAGEVKRFPLSIKAPLRQGINKMDLLLFSNGEKSIESISVGISLELETIGMISPTINVLPAPVCAKKRVLQIHLDTASEDFTATCRFTMTGLGIISNQWILSDTKQPCTGISWMQGQRCSFLSFVDQKQDLINPNVKESVDGRRAYRRIMTKNVNYSETGEKLIRDFLYESVDYKVPEPIPEDDVIEHTWLNIFAKERISIILQWSAELIQTKGSRICHGQSIIHLEDILDFSLEALGSPVSAPVRVYLDAPSRVEHDFSTGPTKVLCKILIENSYRDKQVSVDLSFRQALDGATGSNNNICYTWVGLSEKQLSVKAQKTSKVNNEVVFTSPGTFNLSNFCVNVDGAPLSLAQHIIVVKNSTVR